jgi:hypothetical protein
MTRRLTFPSRITRAIIPDGWVVLNAQVKIFKSPSLSESGPQLWLVRDWTICISVYTDETPLSSRNLLAATLIPKTHTQPPATHEVT